MKSGHGEAEASDSVLGVELEGPTTVPNGRREMAAGFVRNLTTP